MHWFKENQIKTKQNKVSGQKIQNSNHGKWFAINVFKFGTRCIIAPTHLFMFLCTTPMLIALHNFDKCRNNGLGN